jgi:hypothetical protein
MTRTPLARSGPTRRPDPVATSGADGRVGPGTWLAAALPLLACCGVHLLVAGAVIAGWTLLGVVGAGAVALTGAGAALWWRHHHRAGTGSAPGCAGSHPR